jgi:aspartate racemase
MSDLCAGVIGGMGPDATVDFMARVLALTPASGDQDHIRLLVDQNPKIPNRQRAILGGGESPAPTLAAMAARLEASGCDFLVMPCNTAHVFLDAILAATRIPFVSIIDVTLERALGSGADRIGVLASGACIEAGVYQDAIAAAGKTPVLQTQSELADLTLLIARIKTGDRGPGVRAEMQALATGLTERGAEALILGCTEIPIVLGDADADVPLFSSSDILAETTVAIAVGNAPLPRR